MNIELGKDIRLTPEYHQAMETFLNWRYEHPVRLAYMAKVPIAVAWCAIQDYYNK